MSKPVEETKAKTSTKILVTLPVETATLVGHISVEQKRPVGQIVAELIHEKYAGHFVFQPSIAS